MASNEQHLQTIFDNISGCIKEYATKINGKKSKVVCGKDEEYKYLGVTVKAGLNCSFKSMGGQNDRFKRSTWYGKVCGCKVGK